MISSGFGFHEMIARHGVERRVHTSGERKGMLDPFQPEKAEDVERLGRLQAEIHDGFKDWVRESIAEAPDEDVGRLCLEVFACDPGSTDAATVER